MKDIEETLAEYSGRPLETRANWYSPAALSYSRGRPGYPDPVIAEVVEQTGIDAASRLVEIGCGPGTATESFAALGCAMDCVEPNAEFIKIARQRLRKYPKVRLHQCSLEQYEVASGEADAVLAATSFHWVDRDIALLKSADLLRPSGYLVLLWNKELQPSQEVADRLRPVYERLVPELSHRESLQEQLEILESLGHMVNEGGYFLEPMLGHSESTVRYPTARYIDGLKSYSPYLKLESTLREELLGELSATIDTEFGGFVDLSYVTGYQIAQKA